MAEHLHYSCRVGKYDALYLWFSKTKEIIFEIFFFYKFKNLIHAHLYLSLSYFGKKEIKYTYFLPSIFTNRIVAISVDTTIRIVSVIIAVQSLSVQNKYFSNDYSKCDLNN